MEVIVAALITTTIPTLVAWRSKTHAKEARDIVKGNGHGNVVALGERIEAKLDDVLVWQGRHEARHARAEAQRA